MDAFNNKKREVDIQLKVAQERSADPLATAAGHNPAKSKARVAIKAVEKLLPGLKRELTALSKRREALGVTEDDVRMASDSYRTIEQAVADLRASKSGKAAAAGGRSERDSLMAGRSGAAPGYGASVPAASAVAEPSAAAMEQQQLAQERSQDATLLELEEGLGDLDHVARGIRDEATYQIAVIDDTTDKVKRADNSLRARSRDIVRIMQTSNVCWMYITILVLMASLIVLMATAHF